MNCQSIQELMTSQPQVCTPEDTILDVARRLRDANVGSLPVVESRESMTLTGMITDRDIVCRVVASGRGCGEVKVSEEMSTAVTPLQRGDTVDNAVLAMSERQVRRLPVVDDQ